MSIRRFYALGYPLRMVRRNAATLAKTAHKLTDCTVRTQLHSADGHGER
jgi:hypothetical protein